MEWKQIEGYEGLYEVSNTGLVRSMDRMLKAGKLDSRIYKGKIKKPQTLKRSGHQYVFLYKENKMSNKYVHRLVAIAFLDNPNNYPNVCHLDNNPFNNSVDNLYWGTQEDNMKQMSSDNRHRNQYSK
jgi:hypothetical protein